MKYGIILCGVLLLSAIGAFWTLSEKALSNHECFVSITAREMLENDDWIWPTCNGQPRLQKTPLSYWLVAALAKITGQVNEFTARAPSAILAVLTVAAIIYFVSQWLSFRIAVLCAAVWATSLGYIRYSHNARPEMALTFFITLCLLSFYSAITTSSRKKQIIYALIFWVSFGLANLAKGPAPLPLVLIPLFFYVAIFRRWKEVPRLLPIIGTIVFLAIVLPWPLAIAHRLNWDLVLWKREFVDRFFGAYASGDKPVYYYLPRMFLFIAPWFAFLPMTLAAPFYRIWSKKQDVMQFLWLWFVGDLIFITICGGKRQHYILPLMPAMAMLVGILIEDMAFVQKAYTRKFAANVLKIHLMIMLIVAIAGPVYTTRVNPGLLTAGFPQGGGPGFPQGGGPAIIFGVVTAIIAVFAALLFTQRQPGLGLTTVFIGIIVLVMISSVSIVNWLDSGKYSRDFARKVARIVPHLSDPARPADGDGQESQTFVAYKYVSMRFVHYFGRVVPVIKDKSLLYKHYEDGHWVIATGEHLEELLKDIRFRQVYYERQAEFRKGKVSSGALFHKTAAIINGQLSEVRFITQRSVFSVYCPLNAGRAAMLTVEWILAAILPDDKDDAFVT